MSNIQKVELVRPYTQRQFWNEFFGSFVGMGIRVLFVWWAVAAWFPELGLTYWQLILPVYAFRMLTVTAPFRGRTIPWRNVFRSKTEKIEGTVEEVFEYEPYETAK